MWLTPRTRLTKIRATLRWGRGNRAARKLNFQQLKKMQISPCHIVSFMIYYTHEDEKPTLQDARSAFPEGNRRPRPRRARHAELRAQAVQQQALQALQVRRKASGVELHLPQGRQVPLHARPAAPRRDRAQGDREREGAGGDDPRRGHPS